MPYTNSDLTNLNFRLSEAQQDCWMDFIQKRDKRIKRIRVYRDKAIIVFKSTINPKYDCYIIFEDKDGRAYESSNEKNTRKKERKTRSKITPKNEPNQKRIKDTTPNKNPKRRKIKNRKKK